MNVAIPVLLGIVVFAVGGWFAFQSWSSGRNRTYRTRCPRCSQKIRYSARKSGHGCMCPQCGESWTLPTIPETSTAAPAGTGYRLQRN